MVLDKTGLYVAIPLYFVLLSLSAVWAWRRTERLKAEGIADHLSAHYLGGRTFGPIITAGTVFASFFSGYTVVSIVNDGYNVGWLLALRWMPSSAGIVAGYVLTGLRLRKASNVRNHQTPIDFVTDRYQSQVLRYVVAGLQVITSLIYVSAQVIALRSTFNSLFDIDPRNPWSVVVMFALILIFEWVGGLSSVALTDCIQGFIMVLSFVLLPSVIKANFFGWSELSPDMYPKPEFYQTPSKDGQLAFWQFSLINISFFTLPHLMQRLYAARDLKTLRFAWGIMNFGPWMTMFVSAFIGTVGVQILNGEAVTSPFASILDAVMQFGGFSEAVGIIAFTASLAAIMSTADSLIIAISQLVTTEVVYPLRPNASPNEMAWWGRFVSFWTVVFALIIGLLWDKGISDLGKIQFPLTLMVVPPFIWAMYAPPAFDAHPWCIAAGCVLSSIYIVVLYFEYLKPNVESLAIDAGVTGFAIQVVLVYIFEFGRRLYIRRNKKTPESRVHDGVEILYPDRPQWDLPHLRRFGEKPLSNALIKKMMKGVEEPITNAWYTLILFYTICLTTPIVPELEPPLNADGTYDTLPAIVRGMPWWAFKLVVLSVIPYVIIYWAIWKVPDNFPVDEVAIAKHGIDPSTIELTPKEMGRRTSYDERNDLIRSRRESIKETMASLGLTPDEDKAEKETHLTEGQRRLSSIVLGTISESVAEAAKQVADGHESSSEFETAHHDGESPHGSDGNNE